MLGILLAITAAFCWGATVIFVRLGLQQIKPLTATLASLVSSLILVGLLALIINVDAIVSLSPTALLWFGLIGVINFVIGRQFNYLGIRYIGATKATPIFCSSPLFAMILAVIFLGEGVTVLIVTGTLCIMLGIALVVTSE